MRLILEEVFMDENDILKKDGFVMPNTNPAIAHEYYALSPLDGRYSQIGAKLSPYFSEYALMKNRVMVEVRWLEFVVRMVKNPILEKEYIAGAYNNYDLIKSIASDFNEADFIRIKEIEKKTNHDVKSVEMFVGEKLRELNLASLVPFVHIGCTSEDINNPAYSRMIKDSLNDVWLPTATKLIDKLAQMAEETKGITMLAHTHGQPATPTTVGKELAVFVHRLSKALKTISSVSIEAKFNGATGNYSAIQGAFPDIVWPVYSKKFVEDYLGLNFNPVTTQIESHDYMCQLFDGIRHFNNILLDLDQDMWQYISMDYFKQIAVKGEVGSSTMPHKVNPIRFENSEANVGASNALLYWLSDKLPRSRMQRDLSDSSAQRNIGIAFGYSVQAIEQTIGGLEKVSVNEEKIAGELDNNYEVLGELIQTILRKNGNPDAYFILKDLTRGAHVTKQTIEKFVKQCQDLTDEDKRVLSHVTPKDYNGCAEAIVDMTVDRWRNDKSSFCITEQE